MKRFLEYLEEQKNLINEAVPYRFSWQDIDLTDGRQAIRLDRRQFLDTSAKMRDKWMRVTPQPTFGSLNGQIVLPSDSIVRPSDSVSLLLVEQDRRVRTSDPAAKPGLLGFFHERCFVDGYLFQLSFEQLVTFMIRAGLKSLNSGMLVPLQNTRAPVYEDMKITVSPAPDPNEYDRDQVLDFVRDPESHFNKHPARRSKYQKGIIAAKGDVGKTILFKPAARTVKTACYDNYYTDQNWTVAVNPDTMEIETLYKVHPKRLVQMYGLGHRVVPPAVYSRYRLNIPRDAMLRSCEESVCGDIV